ncbi:MAG: alpha/beta hydrolase [Gemmatimonadota bacterium]
MVRRGLLALVLGLLAGCHSSPARSEGSISLPDSLSLHYSVIGNGGDTVIVLHGGPGLQSEYLIGPLSSLASNHTLIFYDQRGRGQSDAVTDSLQLSPDSDVADLETVRQFFRLSHLTLIGHHWGAAVAGLYAIKYPDRVSRIIMLSPFFVHPSFSFEMAMLRTDTAANRRMAEARARQQSPADAPVFCREHWSAYFAPIPLDPRTPVEAIARTICRESPARLFAVEQVNRYMLRQLGYWSWRVALHDVRIPVLVIEGSGNVMVESAAARWAQHLPNARVLLVQPPYLFPWIGDPETFTREVEQFLSGSWPGSSIKPEPYDTASPAASSPQTPTSPRDTTT